MKFKLISTAIAVIIGGLIGLQSTVTSTARAETDIVHITDTVTNYQAIIVKTTVEHTDTLVRTVNKVVYEKDYLWAAKALNLDDPVLVIPDTYKSDMARTETISMSVPIDCQLY